MVLFVGEDFMEAHTVADGFSGEALEIRRSLLAGDFISKEAVLDGFVTATELLRAGLWWQDEFESNWYREGSQRQVDYLKNLVSSAKTSIEAGKRKQTYFEETLKAIERSVLSDPWTVIDLARTALKNLG